MKKALAYVRCSVNSGQSDHRVPIQIDHALPI